MLLCTALRLLVISACMVPMCRAFLIPFAPFFLSPVRF